MVCIRLVDLVSIYVRIKTFRDEKGDALSDEHTADNIIGVLFAAQDTTASVLTWILKYLSDDPKLLDVVKEEKKAVCDSAYGENQALTWSMTRKMPLTYRVILESLRKASVISFTFREATVDVVYDGYLMPKGWKVMPFFRNIHHNPEFFNDPENFDPFRFEVVRELITFINYDVVWNVARVT